VVGRTDNDTEDTGNIETIDYNHPLVMRWTIDADFKGCLPFVYDEDKRDRIECYELNRLFGNLER